MAFCSNCGAKLGEGMRFCTECGAKVPAPDAVVSEAPAAPVNPAPETPAPEAPVTPENPVSEAPAVPENPVSVTPAPDFGAPAGGSYVPPVPPVPPAVPVVSAAPDAPSPAPKKKLKPWVLILIIAGALTVLLPLLIIIIIVAVGNSAVNNNVTDANLGVWHAVSAEVWGIDVDLATLYPDGFTLELKDKGKVTLTVGDVETQGTWKLSGTEFSLSSSGFSCTGTLAEGELTLNNYMGTGVSVTFQKDAGLPGGEAGLLPAGDNAGLYLLETTMAFSNEYYIQFNEDGTGVYAMGPESHTDITWTADTISLNGASFVYTVEGDVLTLNFGTGTVLTYRRGDGTAEPVSDNVPLTWWNGDWYGWWIVDNTQGDYTGWEGDWWDCCARISLDADYTGSMVFWDEDTSEEGCISRMNFFINTEMGGEMGTAVIDDGVFMKMSVTSGQITIDPSAASYENLIVVNTSYTDEKGSFDFRIYLRPWGQLWDDWYADNSSALPYRYENWYLPAIEAGLGMPGEIGAECIADGTGEDEPGDTGSDYTGPQTFHMTDFYAENPSSLSLTVPTGWCWETSGDSQDGDNYKIWIYAVPSRDDAYSNTPRIQFEVKSQVKDFDFYMTDFEDLRTIDSRVIGGITMEGRTYTDLGMEWTEYLGQITDDYAISIKISKVDVSAGTAGDALLNSVSFN